MLAAQDRDSPSIYVLSGQSVDLAGLKTASQNDLFPIGSRRLGLSRCRYLVAGLVKFEIHEILNTCV